MDEEELLQTVARTVGQRFLKMVNQLDLLILDKTKFRQRHDERNGDHTQRIEALEGKLDNARRRLLEVDQDMVPHVQHGIREIEQELRLAQASQPEVNWEVQYELEQHRLQNAIVTMANLSEMIGKRDYGPKTRHLMFQQYNVTVTLNIGRRPLGAVRHTCELIGGSVESTVKGVEPSSFALGNRYIPITPSNHKEA